MHFRLYYITPKFSSKPKCLFDLFEGYTYFETAITIDAYRYSITKLVKFDFKPSSSSYQSAWGKPIKMKLLKSWHSDTYPTEQDLIDLIESYPEYLI